MRSYLGTKLAWKADLAIGNGGIMSGPIAVGYFREEGRVRKLPLEGAPYPAGLARRSECKMVQTRITSNVEKRNW